MLKIVAAECELGETKREYKERVEKERKERFGAKRLHGKFFRDVRDVADGRSWQWVKAGYMAKSMEGFVFAAQEQALPTRSYRADIQGEDISSACRVCGKTPESVGHLASGCSGMAQREYKRRHDRMGLRVYWELCKKYGVMCAGRWFEEVPDEVRVSDDKKYEIWWDRSVNTTQQMEHNRPDVVVVDRIKKMWVIVDFSVPWDKNIVSKEEEKILNYSPLAKEIRKMHRVSTKVVPVVVGALGVVSRNLVGYLE